MAPWISQCLFACNLPHEALFSQLVEFVLLLLDEVFVISGIIKVEVSVISRSRRVGGRGNSHVKVTGVLVGKLEFNP